jgi:hypothetical protein
VKRSDLTATAVAVGRFAVGGGALVAPRVTGRTFGIDADEDTASVYLARLFGARAVAMAAMMLGARGAERRRHLAVGVAVDVVDAVAAAAAGRAGQLPKRAASLACAAAVVEAAIGATALVSMGSVSDGRTRSRS